VFIGGAVLPKAEAEPWPNCLLSVLAAGGSWGHVLEGFAKAERRPDAELGEGEPNPLLKEMLRVRVGSASAA